MVLGFAFVENNKTSMFKTPSETSIFAAVSQAIEKVMSHVVNMGFDQILIISDPYSALFALKKNPYPKSEIIQAIQKMLSHSNREIEFLRVSS
jgi:CDP-glycerol glycerophosphotransferase (TagB/SpsB family)